MDLLVIRNYEMPNKFSVLLILSLLLSGVAAADKLSTTTDSYLEVTGEHCIDGCYADYVAIGPYYVAQIYNSAGDVVAAQQTHIPTSVVLPRQRNGDFPLPPAGGTGDVVRLESGEGISDGVAGVWFLRSIYTFVNFQVVRITASSHFEPYNRPRGIPGDGDN